MDAWHEMLARCALRHDTSMSRAMLRALGIDAPEPVRYGTIARVDRYAGVRDCFAQTHGVDMR